MTDKIELYNDINSVNGNTTRALADHLYSLGYRKHTTLTASADIAQEVSTDTADAKASEREAIRWWLVDHGYSHMSVIDALADLNARIVEKMNVISDMAERVASLPAKTDQKQDERSAFDAWFKEYKRLPLETDTTWADSAFDAYRAFKAGRASLAYNLQTGEPVVRGHHELTVWYGAMPESNGKSNFTAILMRKGDNTLTSMTDGITIACSEYPERVRYEADRVRYLIGELKERPFILDYDADKHSGYVQKCIEPIPFEAIDKILNECMTRAVENGANSASMPDEYVAVAHFLSFPEKYTPAQHETVAVIQGQSK